MLALTSAFLLSAGCKKLIETDSPKNQLTPDKVYTDTNAVKSVLLNIYANFERNINPSLQLSLGLYSDELSYYGNDASTTEFYQSKVSPGNQRNLNIWSRFYAMIYQCNDILEQLPLADRLPSAFKQRISGEALFLRGFAYFHLVNLYEDIPLILETDVNLTAKAKQVNPDNIYGQIEKDLIAAKELLKYYAKTPLNTRASEYAVTALLSKVYLYQKKWELAELNANTLINSGTFKLDDPENVFKASSTETIFQFWTPQGYNYTSPELILSSSNSPQYAMNIKFADSFENEDLRKLYWTGLKIINDGTKDIKYVYTAKYINTTANNLDPEYFIVFRLSEQYLIQAEARAEQGDFDGALTSVNIVRKRANLQALSQLNSIQDSRNAIFKERRSELFMEDADRFFDLKRTDRLNHVMGELKPSWLPRAKNLPIPRSELVANTNLIQNQDY
jgi:hypothetical protein